jgi:hypothetical protein
MSRLTEEIVNPAVKTLKWKNAAFEDVLDAKGKPVRDDQNKIVRNQKRTTGWYYWDKTANDGDGADIEVEMPFKFVWLETAHSISGFNQNKSQGVYSNEVLDLNKSELVVKVGQDIEATGFYNKKNTAFKEQVKGIGGKYCAAVYAGLVNTDGEIEIVRFLCTGSSRDSWMTLSQDRNSLKNKMIVCIGAQEESIKTGGTYEKPVFKFVDAQEEQLQIADELAEKVSKYFDYYLNNNQSKTIEANVENAPIEEEDMSLPF